MSVTVKLEAQARSPEKNKGTGTRVARKLRQQGLIPAIIYGHKEPNLPIALKHDDVWRIMKQQSHRVDLVVAGKTEEVLVRHVQWDHLSRDIIHLDFYRVSPEETVESIVRLEFKGTPAGVAAGGLLETPVHELKVDCRADSIPDLIAVDLSGLELGQSLYARDVPLPAGVKLHGNPDLLVAHVVAKPVKVEAAPAAPAEGQA